MITRFVKLVSLFVMLSAACLAQTGTVVSTNAPHGIPVKNAVATRAAQASPANNGILYNGGPIMNKPSGTNVYFIWYGNWSGDSAKQILPDFVRHLGGSLYFNINTTYYDYGPQGQQDPVFKKVNFVAGVDDNYSVGTSLSVFDVAQLVATHTGGDLPIDENGVYFVLTSVDVNQWTVNQGQYCVNYCAWHINATVVYPNLPGTRDIKVAFAGNPNQCPAACVAQNPSPNNNPAADTMASFVAHELEESVTDPDGNAWINPDGSENADLCVWRFGPYFALPNGSYANMKLGTRYYLIQRNWVNSKGGYCALKWGD